MTAAPTVVDFLREMFAKSSGPIWVGAFRNNDSKLKKGQVGAPIIGRDVKAIAAFAIKYDRRELEVGIYFSVCTLKDGATSREGADVSQIVAIQADIDDDNHSLTREEVLERLNELPCPPSIIVASGHGLQAYWLLDMATTDIETAVELRKKLQSMTASDSVHDAPRVLRLPDTHNSKRGDWIGVEIICWHPEHRYSLEGLQTWAAHEGNIIPREETQTAKSGGGDDRPRKSKRHFDDAPASIDDVSAALRHIDADDRDVWCKVGMALHAEFGDAGRPLWDEWSKGSSKYDELDQDKNWHSFQANGGIEIGTVFHYAKQGGWERKREKQYTNGKDARQRQDKHRSEKNRHHAHTAADAPASDGKMCIGDFRAYMPGHSYIYIPSREFWESASINIRLPAMPGPGDKEISPTKWLDLNAHVEQMTWAPGLPMLIENRLISEGGWIDRPGDTVFNLYRPPIVELGNAAKAERWLEHLHKMFAEGTEHIIKYLAFKVQKPGEKINHAMVWGGKQGIGKDTALEPVKYAIGAWNFREVSPNNVLGRFNGFLRAVILRINEAADFGDVQAIDRYKFYEHMKTLCAAPPDVLLVDEKYVREYSILNCVAPIITTNHKTDGIYLPADDRRNYVLWSERTIGDFDQAYWDGMWRWYLTDGGLKDVAAYLMTLDISDFDPKAPPPKTAAFWEIVDANRAPEDSEMADIIDQLRNPNALTISDIIQKAKEHFTNMDFADWLEERRNAKRVPYRLENCGYVAVRNNESSDGLWKVGDRRRVIYAKDKLPVRDRIEAARNLTEERRHTSK